MGNTIDKPIDKWSTPTEAIGGQLDEPAISVDDPQSMVSLLKAILRDINSGTVAARAGALEAGTDSLDARITALEPPPEPMREEH
jgi:hypothetical protein